ncbi:MAG: hypothetical protein EBR59_06780 [Methylococcaceae bacterium]|nr:hypothetical protein [Methylococcaceae bacterium]
MLSTTLNCSKTKIIKRLKQVLSAVKRRRDCTLGLIFQVICQTKYKSVRDQLDGWDNSTKFSPWLSNGCLSVRQIYSDLKAYQAKNGRNESSDWIFFELLWREFFQWNAYIHSAQLFRFRGVKSTPPLTSFYAERFQKWCKGNTPFPLVNASMNQLSRTGYISNRARQIVASCLVNELDLDWRYGAAYFEQQLLDYDVAVNRVYHASLEETHYGKSYLFRGQRPSHRFMLFT